MTLVPLPGALMVSDPESLTDVRLAVGAALREEENWRLGPRELWATADAHLAALASAAAALGDEGNEALVAARRAWYLDQFGQTFAAADLLDEVLGRMSRLLDEARPSPALLDGLANATVELAELRSRQNRTLEAVAHLAGLRDLLERSPSDVGRVRVLPAINLALASALLRLGATEAAATVAERELGGADLPAVDRARAAGLLARILAADPSAGDSDNFDPPATMAARAAEDLHEEIAGQSARTSRPLKAVRGLAAELEAQVVEHLCDAGNLPEADTYLAQVIARGDGVTTEHLSALHRLFIAGVDRPLALDVPGVRSAIRASGPWVSEVRLCEAMVDERSNASNLAERIDALLVLARAQLRQWSLGPAVESVRTAGDLASGAKDGHRIVEAALLEALARWLGADGATGSVADPIVTAQHRHAVDELARARLATARGLLDEWETADGPGNESVVYAAGELTSLSEDLSTERVVASLRPGPAGIVTLAREDGMPEGVTVTFDAASMVLLGWRESPVDGRDLWSLMRRVGSDDANRISINEPIVRALRELAVVRLAWDMPIDQAARTSAVGLVSATLLRAQAAVALHQLGELGVVSQASVSIAKEVARESFLAAADQLAGMNVGSADVDSDGPIPVVLAHDVRNQMLEVLELDVDELRPALSHLTRSVLSLDEQFASLAEAPGAIRSAPPLAQGDPATGRSTAQSVLSREEARFVSRQASAANLRHRSPHMWSIAADAWAAHDPGMAAVCKWYLGREVLPGASAGDRPALSGVSGDADGFALLHILLAAGHAPLLLGAWDGLTLGRPPVP